MHNSHMKLLGVLVKKYRVVLSFGILAIALFACKRNTSSSVENSNFNKNLNQNTNQNVACQPDLSKLLRSASVSLGGKLEIDLSGLTNEVNVELLTIPDAWHHEWKNDPRSLSIKAPYTASNESELVVELGITCSDFSATHSITLSTRSLRWSRVPKWLSNVTGPSPRGRPHIWLDRNNPDRLFLWGGQISNPHRPATDLWSLNLVTGHWTYIPTQGPAPAYVGNHLVVLPEQSAILLIGGVDIYNQVADVIYRLDYQNDVFQWSTLMFSGEAGSAFGGAMLYDIKRNRVLSVCGYDHQYVAITCTVKALILDEGNAKWQTVAISESEQPEGREGFAWVYDQQNDRVVIFSGNSAAHPELPSLLDDTWALNLGENPLHWKMLNINSTSQSSRRYPMSILDPVGHRMIVYGGGVSSKSVRPGISILDLDSGKENWRREPGIYTPYPRYAATLMGVFDPIRKRVYFGFGNSQDSYIADFFALRL